MVIALNAQDLRAKAKGASFFFVFFFAQIRYSKSQNLIFAYVRKQLSPHAQVDFLLDFPSGAGVGVTALRSSGL